MRGHSGGGGDDRYGNEVRREMEIPTFPPLPLCVYPSEKRANKTFIIPGKLFNVFGIKRLKRKREREREAGGEKGGGIQELSCEVYQSQTTNQTPED